MQGHASRRGSAAGGGERTAHSRTLPSLGLPVEGAWMPMLASVPVAATGRNWFV